MKLNTDRLNAFYQVALDRNFHTAAENLCVTQSALSQRVLKLEQEIKTTLFIRANDGIKLTESGSLLFDYVRDLQQRETEALNGLTGRSNVPNGIIRVAAFSSVLRSVVMPALSSLIRDSNGGHVEFFSRELRELPYMLKTGEADFIVHDNPKLSGDLVAIPLGDEELVYVRGKHRQKHPKAKNNNIQKQPCFLDHDVDDMTTHHFLTAQGVKNTDIHRSFYDDIYGVLDGVRLGFGDAIVSKHLVENESQIEVIQYDKNVTSPVILYYQKNRYLTDYQEQVIQLLRENTSQYLTCSE